MFATWLTVWQYQRMEVNLTAFILADWMITLRYTSLHYPTIRIKVCMTPCEMVPIHTLPLPPHTCHAQYLLSYLILLPVLAALEGWQATLPVISNCVHNSRSSRRSSWDCNWVRTTGMFLCLRVRGGCTSEWWDGWLIPKGLWLFSTWHGWHDNSRLAAEMCSTVKCFPLWFVLGQHTILGF